MAQRETGRRETVQDPLRQSAQQVLPERALPMTGVRSPANPSMAGFQQEASQLSNAMGSISGVLNDIFEENKDKWITEGKVAYQSGVTEDQLMENGNRYTQLGYLQLKTRNDVNNWYMGQQSTLAEKASTLSPEAYQEYLGQSRKQYLDTIEDPYAKKVASAAFEQFSPQLASKQFIANNDYNMEQREKEAFEFFMTGSVASPTRSVQSGDTALKLAPQPVAPVMQLSAMDRDVGIKTLIGEAGNQGDLGMAAVAHVLVNRSTDSRFPSSIGGVALQGKGSRSAQFSIWGSTKANAESYLSKLRPGNPKYDKAAKVFDAVMSGRHVDPTGGAVNYYSPSGMKAYIKQGIQRHSVPSWAAKSESENLVVIGAHRFSGKSNGVQAAPRLMQAAQEAGVPIPEDRPTDLMGAKTSDVNNTEGTPAGVGVEALNTAPAEEGVSGISDSGAPNEIQDFISNYKGLPKDRLVAQLSQAMIVQLSAGDDTLFNDAGGTAALFKLGATPAQIDKVMKAKSKWQIEQDKKFDADDLAFEDDILRLAGDGDTTREDIFERIDQRIEAGMMSDAQGRALASRAAGEIRSYDEKEGKDSNSIFGDTEFLQEIGGIYQDVQTGMDFDIASEAVKELAERYGADQDDVERLLGRVFELDQSRQNKLRAKAEQAAAQAETSNVNKSEAERSIARGFGLADSKGQVRVTNPDGSVSKMSAKEYGIETIRTRALEDGAGDTAQVAHSFFTQLQRQGIVDNKTQAQMVGALTGQIIDPKTGKVSDDAQQAYDLYTILKQDPEINDGYLSEIVGDTYTRQILELAYTLDAGNLTGPEALVRAKALADDEHAPKDTYARTDAFRAMTDVASEELITELSEPNLLPWLIGSYDPDEVEQAVGTGSEMVRNRLMLAADSYKLQYPWQDPAAALELAKQDIKRDMKIVSGNVILTPDNIAQKMGISNPENVNDAFKGFIKANGATIWPNSDDGIMGTGLMEDGGYDEQYRGEMYSSATKWGSEINAPVTVRWMGNIGQNGSFQVWLNDPDKPGGVDTGSMVVIPADEIGTWYTHSKSSKGAFGQMFDKVNRGVAEVRKGPGTAADSGGGGF